MFKKLCLFAAVIVFALLCGCDFEFDFKDVDEYSGFATEFYEACDELTEHAETLIEEEQAIVKSFFSVDMALFGTLRISESMYYLIIGLNKKGLTNADMETMQNLLIVEIDGGYMMTFTQDGAETEIRLIYNKDNSKLTAFENGEMIYFLERIKLGDDEYAAQFCFVQPEEENYLTGQLYVKGLTGRISIRGQTEQPASIYDNPDAVNDDFAADGDRVYIIEENSFTYQGIETGDETGDESGDEETE